MFRKLKDLTGQKFGKLTVIERGPNRIRETGVAARWFCQCDCGSDIRLVYAGGLLSGGTKSCGCVWKNNNEKSGQWRGCGELSLTRWNHIIAHSKMRATVLEFSITIEYAWELFLKQDRKCALTGEPLSLKLEKKNWYGNASLDRIDSTKGYIEGNVQWVTKKINKIKQNLPQDKFIDWCKAITEYMRTDL